MAKKWLAFEWDARRIRVLAASPRDGQLNIDDVFRIDVPEGSNPVEARVGEALARALNERKLGRAETWVAIGRSSAELKQLTLPPAPEEELPDMVRFQAMREFHSIGEEWALDFVPLRTGSETAQEVLAAAIAPEVVQRIQAACQAARLKADHLVLRPFAGASLLRKMAVGEASQVKLLVDVLPDELDLTVLVDDRVVFLRTARIHGDEVLQDPEASRSVISEIRRTLAAVHSQLGDRRVEAIYLCGDESSHRRLAENIAQSLSLPAQPFDPFAAAGLAGVPGELTGRGRFAPLLGMLLDAAEEVPPAIDFLHPRRRPQPPSQRRPFLIGGVAAAVLVGAVGASVWSSVARLNEQIELKQKELTQLNELVPAATAQQNRIEEIREWSDARVVWLDELKRLSKDLPEAKRLMLTQLICAARQQGGEMQLQGVVSGSDVAGDLAARLRDEDHQVVPGSIQEAERKGRYSWRFKAGIAVAGPEEVDYRADEDAEAAKKTASREER